METIVLIQIPDLVMVPCPLTDKTTNLETRSTMQVCLHWCARECVCVCGVCEVCVYVLVSHV